MEIRPSGRVHSPSMGSAEGSFRAIRTARRVGPHDGDRIEVMFLAKANPAAAVVDTPGRAIRLSEMHKVPQFCLPVMNIVTPHHLVKMT